jgi:hypothetical protein
VGKEKKDLSFCEPDDYSVLSTYYAKLENDMYSTYQGDDGDDDYDDNVIYQDNNKEKGEEEEEEDTDDFDCYGGRPCGIPGIFNMDLDNDESFLFCDSPPEFAGPARLSPMEDDTNTPSETVRNDDENNNSHHHHHRDHDHDDNPKTGETNQQKVRIEESEELSSPRDIIPVIIPCPNNSISPHDDFGPHGIVPKKRKRIEKRTKMPPVRPGKEQRKKKITEDKNESLYGDIKDNVSPWEIRDKEHLEYIKRILCINSVERRKIK